MDSVDGRNTLVEESLEYKLFGACKAGDIGLVNELLRQDVNIDFQNDEEDGFTALHHAVQNGHSEIVELLIQAGAKANIRTNRFQQIPLLLLSSHNDIENSKAKAIAHALVKAKDCNINEAKYHGYTILHNLIMGGRTELLQFFVDLGCDVNLQDFNGSSPLSLACYENNAEAVKVLLGANACTDTTDAMHGFNPLHFAAWKSSADIVQLLLKVGVDVNHVDREGKTVLHHLIRRGQAELLQFFVDRGCDVNLQDYNGSSPLSLACWENNAEAVKVLLGANASTDTTDIEGFTPLHYAAYRSSPDIVQLLLQKGAHYHNEDNSARTPLQLSTLECDRRKDECLQVAKHLLKAGADVNHVDDEEQTALHLVATKDNVVFLQLLLDAGPNPDVQDIHGNTPLHLATNTGLLQNVRALLAGKSSMDIRNQDGKFPIHCVIDNIVRTPRNSLALLKVFLGAGAASKVELRDGDMDNIVKEFIIEDSRHKTVDLADISEFLQLLHEARLLSSSTTKDLLAIMKQELHFPSLTCLARTCAQLHMRHHTAGAYAELGLPPTLQKYMAYEDKH